MAQPITEGHILAFIEAAREAEVGIAITVDAPETIVLIRNRLASAGAGEEFTVHAMDNPLEVWVVRKGTEVPDADEVRPKLRRI